MCAPLPPPQALAEASDLEALRTEKRAIIAEEKRLKALLEMERAKAARKADRQAAARAEKQRQAAKLEYRREKVRGVAGDLDWRGCLGVSVARVSAAVL